MRYYFHVNFECNFPYGGFVDVDEKTPIKEVVNKCKSKMKELNKDEWKRETKDLSMFRVYYLSNIGEMDVFGWDKSMGNKTYISNQKKK